MVNVCKTHHSPWITHNIRTLVNKKKRAYRQLRSNPSPHNLAAYKESRNKAVTAIRQAKFSYEKDLIFRAKIQPKLLYAYLNANKKTQPANCIKTSDGSTLFDDSEIAITLNNHFASVFPPSSRQLTHTPCTGLVSFNQSDVMEALSSLKEGTASGPDQLSSTFLKNCAASLALPIYLIFQTSIRSCTFPTIWKDANVTPILKSGSPLIAKNYRPVSLLSSLSKLLERFVFKEMLMFAMSTMFYTHLNTASFLAALALPTFFTPMIKLLELLTLGFLVMLFFSILAKLLIPYSIPFL